MNRKGFTLIELLVVIVIIGIIGILIVPNALQFAETSKEKSYDILIKNIVTSSQIYYEECEYGDLSSSEKYGEYACSISNNSITTTLKALANTGILEVKDTDESGSKIVLNPKNNTNMSNCQIKIAKVKEIKIDENGIENIKVTYEVTAESGSDCPTTKEYEGAVQ